MNRYRIGFRAAQAAWECPDDDGPDDDRPETKVCENCNRETPLEDMSEAEPWLCSECYKADFYGPEGEP